MLTWKFWRALNNPPHSHPLFRRAFVTHHKVKPRRARKILLMFLLLFIATGFCWTVLSTWIPLIIVITLALVNSLYSSIWAVNISSVIAEEHQQNRYDLLSIFPCGALGVNWAMGMGRLHRTGLFKWAQLLVRLATTILLITLALTLFFSVFMAAKNDMPPTDQLAQEANTELASSIIYGIALNIAFYIDHVQSSILSNLIGIVASVNIRNHAEARMRALGGFLIAQIAVYASSVLIVFYVLPGLHRAMNLADWAVPLSLSILGLLVFYSIRETIIHFTWQRLAAQLNADSAGLDFLIRGAV